MNENQEAVKTEVEENVSFDFDDDNNLASEEVSVPEKNEETRTIVQESEDSSEDSELENYSENVQKRINQLTAKRKQALEEAEAAYTYAQQVQQQNEEKTTERNVQSTKVFHWLSQFWRFHWLILLVFRFPGNPSGCLSWTSSNTFL